MKTDAPAGARLRRQRLVLTGLVVSVASAALATPVAAAQVPAARVPAGRVLAATGKGTPVAPTTTAPTTLLPANATLAPIVVNGVPVLTFVAAAKSRRTTIYATKNAAKGDVVMDNASNYSGRHVFTVIARDGDWLNVRVPIRPNGRSGWVKLSDVNLFQHDYAVIVSLSQHSLVVYKSGKEIQRERVAVGQAKYPTPLGSYFIRELARPSNPKGAYGPWAFGLSAYSTVLTRFGRGDGQVGIHGTNAPQLLGTNASHGCIRVSNAGITKMAQTLPQGVPVEIRA